MIKLFAFWNSCCHRLRGFLTYLDFPVFVDSVCEYLSQTEERDSQIRAIVVRPWNYQGNLATTTPTTAKTSLLKRIRVFSNVAINPTRFKCQMQVKFHGVEFLETTPKFRKRKKNSSSCVYVLHKTSHQEISRASRAVTAKKCTKKSNARAVLLFWLLSLLLLFFDVLVAVAVIVAKAPYCRLTLKLLPALYANKTQTTSGL